MPENEPLLLHLTLPAGHPRRLTIGGKPVSLLVEELAERRLSISQCRNDLRLEGLAEPHEIQSLSEAFIRGELTPNSFRDACFEYAKTLAKDPSWTRQTGRLAE